MPSSVRLIRARVETLAGKCYEVTHSTPGNQLIELSQSTPYLGAAMPQDKLEHVLRMKAVELGTEMKLGTDLLSFSQDKDGVAALAQDKHGKQSQITTSCLVEAEGHRSSIREIRDQS
jgi:2-polyprenyl-6-methoxyphenol hydroxylase-like FAD-dependent oxidoreductase